MIDGLTEKARILAATEKANQSGNGKKDEPQTGDPGAQTQESESDIVAKSIPPTLSTNTSTTKASANESGDKIDLNPKSLHISEDEHTFMRSTAPLLGRSPRALKRFVNVYRLIKSRVAFDEMDDFLVKRGCDSRYKIVMFLLAIVTGLPGLSRDLFEMLWTLDDQNSQQKDPSNHYRLKEVIGRLKDKTKASDELEILSKWTMNSKKDKWNDAELNSLADEARQVARFSFRVESL